MGSFGQVDGRQGSIGMKMHFLWTPGLAVVKTLMLLAVAISKLNLETKLVILKGLNGFQFGVGRKERLVGVVYW